ncbi:hypothetical protein V8F33_004961 [Rhypophila sp. PSN 637]
MDTYRHDDSEDRIRLQMELRPLSLNSTTTRSGLVLSAAWTVLMDVEVNRAHLTHIMSNGLFSHHPTRHVVPCDRVHVSKREWRIREFPENENPAASRWSGRILLFVFGPDVLENFPGLEVLHQGMIQCACIWSYPDDKIFHYERRRSSEYTPAENVNYNDISDDEPYQCLGWLWAGDQSNRMNASDLSLARYRGEHDTHINSAIATTGNDGDSNSAVTSHAGREDAGHHRGKIQAGPAQPGVRVEVVHVQGSFWDNMVRLAAQPNLTPIFLALGAGLSCVLIWGALAGLMIVITVADDMDRRSKYTYGGH